MLILKRHHGEAVVIRAGGRIVAKVKCNEMDRSRAVLAFEIPADVEVNRIELDAQLHPEDYTDGPPKLES